MTARSPALAPVHVLLAAAALVACGRGEPSAPAGPSSPPANLILASGDGQSAVRGSTLAPFVVRVTDARDQPVAGATVTWTVTEGNGSISPRSSRSAPDGTAWAVATLAIGSATNRFAAAATGAGEPVVFMAKGVAGPPAKLAAVGGGSQTAVVATTLAAPLVIQIRDANDVPVRGASVVWSAGSGGSGVAPSTVLTDAEGLASVTARLRQGAGTNVFTASPVGFAAREVSFPATGVAGPPARLQRISPSGGRLAAGSAQALAVRVTDRYGNPVQGVAVHWARTAGTGAISPSSSTTDGSGEARATATLGAAQGANGYTATARLQGSPVRFSLSGE